MMGETENPPARGSVGLGGHMPALDGIRGIAILLVMLHHFTIYGMGRPSAFVDRLFYVVVAAGWCGVDLFFVLSGFLITGILLDAKGGEHFFRNFYIRRMLRIFPLYYGFLFVFFVLLPHVLPLEGRLQSLSAEQIWYWSYLVNLSIAFEGWPRPYVIGHFWSLAVEEQFYLFWPVIVFFSNSRQLAMICLFCFAASFGLRLGFALAGYPLAAYVLTPARMDTLAAGAFLALAVRQPNGLATLSRWIWPVGGASLAALGIIFISNRGLGSTQFAVQTVGYSVLALLFGALVGAGVLSRGNAGLGRVFAHPALVFFGRYSYALYVFHHPVALLLRENMVAESGLPVLLGLQLPAHALFLAAATGLSVFLALLSWHAYESRFLKLKSLFPYCRNPNAVGRKGYGIVHCPGS